MMKIRKKVLIRCVLLPLNICKCHSTSHAVPASRKMGLWLVGIEEKRIFVTPLGISQAALHGLLAKG